MLHLPHCTGLFSEKFTLEYLHVQSEKKLSDSNCAIAGSGDCILWMPYFIHCISNNFSCLKETTLATTRSDCNPNAYTCDFQYQDFLTLQNMWHFQPVLWLRAVLDQTGLGEIMVKSFNAYLEISHSEAKSLTSTPRLLYSSHLINSSSTALLDLLLKTPSYLRQSIPISLLHHW